MQLARRGERPTSLDFIRRCLSGFVELHGDRLYGDDPSIVAGIGDLDGRTVAVIGQERGHDLTSRERHEGRIYPEGFRKAQRMMRLAAKLQAPLVTFIDTSGPNYGREAEERGIGNAISSTTALMAQLPVPTISVVVGEAGSEGALAMSIADRILMLERAVYNVTSPDVATAMLHHEALSRRGATRTPPAVGPGLPGAGDHRRCGAGAAGGRQRQPQRRRPAAQGRAGGGDVGADGPLHQAHPPGQAPEVPQDGEYSSHFRVALSREASTLQGYMAQGVRLIRRRPRRGGGR